MTAFALNRPQRRGACPGLSKPTPTGDGLLARLMPTGTISLEAFTALCAAARQYGNGIIEITGRGSIQIRGLTNDSAPHFADAVTALEITVEDGVPVLCNALAGLEAEEAIEAAALAAELRRSLARTSFAAKLAPKVSVVIDGGGALCLDEVAADVRLCGAAQNDKTVLRVSVGGDFATAAPVGVVPFADGVEAAKRLLSVIADRVRAARARDILATVGDKPFRAAIADLLVVRAKGNGDSDVVSRVHANRRTNDPIGAHPLRGESFAYGVGLPFGHADATALEQLAQAAGAAGATGIRAAAGRALMIIGVLPKMASSLAANAEKLGFVIHSDDPRRRVIACAGAPVCSSAHIAARALAPQIAETAAKYLTGKSRIHVSGCAKGCAYAAAAKLTIVGAAEGCGIVADGSARDVPVAIVTTGELLPAVARLIGNEARAVSHV